MERLEEKLIAAWERIKRSVDDALTGTTEDELPTVMHRKNNCEWLVTMRLDDWVDLYREWRADNNA